MIELTEPQRRQVQAAGETPVRFSDPDTSREYVLVRAEIFERLKNVLYSDSELAVADAYPLIDAVMSREGWDDPAMDIYNDLAPKDAP